MKRIENHIKQYGDNNRKIELIRGRESIFEKMTIICKK
jgi:hypothetical protein